MKSVVQAIVSSVPREFQFILLIVWKITFCFFVLKDFQSNEYSTPTLKKPSSIVFMNSDSSSSSVTNVPVVSADAELSKKKFSPSASSQIPATYASRNDQPPKYDKLTISASAAPKTAITPSSFHQNASDPPSSKATGSGTISRQNSSLTLTRHLASAGEQTQSLNPTASPSALPPPMLTRLPRRPKTVEEQISPSTQNSAFQSTIALRDIRRARNNSDAASPFSKNPSGHAKQLALNTQPTIMHPKNLRPEATKEITSPTETNLSSTTSPLLHPLSSSSPSDEQRSGSFLQDSERATLPSSVTPDSESRLGTVKELTISNDQTDKKPAHWPKQAPNVHWITPEVTPTP